MSSQLVIGDGSTAEFRISLFAEDCLDGGFKETRQFKGQRKTGVEFARLDGVDRLARNLQPLRQIGLRSLPLRTQYSQPVLHLYLASSTGMERPRKTQKMVIVKMGSRCRMWT